MRSMRCVKEGERNGTEGGGREGLNGTGHANRLFSFFDLEILLNLKNLNLNLSFFSLFPPPPPLNLLRASTSSEATPSTWDRTPSSSASARSRRISPG